MGENQLMNRFKREGPGAWICVEPAVLVTPQGRVEITPGMRFTLGTKFMNVEIARLLDDEYARFGPSTRPRVVALPDSATPARKPNT